MRILVVDDDRVTRTKLAILLEAHGDCDTAEDGDQAWELFQKAHEAGRPYDLITMDIDMPGMKGHEAVAKIRKWENDNVVYASRDEAKILMVTSMRSRSDVLSSFRAGCECFLRKPIKPDALDESLIELGFIKCIK